MIATNGVVVEWMCVNATDLMPNGKICLVKKHCDILHSKTKSPIMVRSLGHWRSTIYAEICRPTTIWSSTPGYCKGYIDHMCIKWSANHSILSDFCIFRSNYAILFEIPTDIWQLHRVSICNRFSCGKSNWVNSLPCANNKTYCSLCVDTSTCVGRGSKYDKEIIIEATYIMTRTPLSIEYHIIK